MSSVISETPPRGRFITLEGIDGAGKSTHLPWLKDALERAGRRVWVSREPGGTPVGERLREMLLHESMSPLAEALLMFAARREHCERAIWPRLADGTWIVCDRFADATYAYQGGGHGVALETIGELERLTLGEFRPDLTVVFDVPVEVSRERLATGRELDRFERQRDEFFTRVRATYLQRARAEPKRMRVIDGTRSPDAVRAELLPIVEAL
ncbi:MAG TPA: dTMP kinase [Casimicrobiaceae bacterium]|jgi:dTMP kinase|nr:dTMP kinase [Casimicrobiaceae bacterium]